MAVYNGSLGKKLASPALAAAARDSLSDSIATAVVLVSSAVGHFIRINIDGWCGAAVAVFVLRAGIMSVRDTLAPLLGTEPDPEFVKRINDIVLSYPEISAIHDLIIHDYGPGRQIISLHAEMPTESGSDIFKLHDIVDNAERRLRQELGCDATIHLDPVAAEDEQTQMLHERMEAALFEINSGLTMHDFRIVPGPTHTNLIFDVVVPYDNKMPQAEILEKSNMPQRNSLQGKTAENTMLSFVSTDRSRDASGNISDETDRLHGIISREIYAYCAIKPSDGSLCNKKVICGAIYKYGFFCCQNG